MKKSLLASLLISSVFAFPAFAAEEAADAPAAAPAPAAEAKPKAPAADYVILKVGPQEIKRSEVEETWKGLFPNGAAPDFNTFDESIRQNVLRGLVSERLLYSEATKDGFDKNPEVQKRLAQLQKQTILQAFIENKSKSLVTDQQLRTAYAEKAAAMKDKEEVRARHILTPSEEEAKEIAELLKKGGDFEKIAKEKSTDKGSGAQGGDLGYFTKDKMVPEFADAAFKLKKGELSAPVKSPFGWHVIKLEDRRKASVQPFEEMKDSLRMELTGKAVQEYVEGLLKTANVQYFGPDGKPREFSLSFQPPAESAPAAGKEEKPKQ